MAHYHCVLVDADGRRIRTVEQAPDEATLRRRIVATGSRPVSIRPSGRQSRPGFARRRREVLELTQSLSVMVSSGVSVAQALRSLVDDDLDRAGSSLAGTIVSRLDKGESFSDIVSGMREVFGDTYVGLVSVGEEAGTLERVLPMLAEFLLRRDRTRGRVIGSLIYPAIVLVTAVIGIGAIVFYAVPRLSRIIQAIDQSAGGDLLNQIALFRLGAVSLFGVGLFLLFLWPTVMILRRRHSSFALRWDSFVLSLPLVGPFARWSNSLSFCFSMSALLDAGVSVSQALAYAGRTASNLRYRRAVEEVRTRVLRGEVFDTAIRSDPLAFPSLIWKWTRVAFETGKLAAAFDQLREYFAHKVDQAVSRFVSLIEPALILGVGLLLILIVIFFVQPLFASLGTAL